MSYLLRPRDKLGSPYTLKVPFYSITTVAEVHRMIAVYQAVSYMLFMHYYFGLIQTL